MSNQLPHDPHGNEIEADLSAYAPRPPRIDRDRLMFEAGRAAQVSQAVGGAVLRPGLIAWFPLQPTLIPSNWVWPASTLAMTLLAAALGIALLLRGDGTERVPIVDRVAAAPEVAARHPITSGGLPAAMQRSADAAAASGTALTLDALPKDHLLRVRQVALTEPIDATPEPVGREPARLAPPPTRGALMRTMLMSRRAGSSAAALWQWSSWVTPEGQR